MAARPLLVLLVLLTLLPLATAHHPQQLAGRTVIFDHKGGNEWWVEAVLTGADAASVTRVEARDTNGPWIPLEKKWWGAWAASFRIEPGHQVQFRSAWPDGSQITSCWFTHPAGNEQCQSPFDASFAGVTGNEWWIQAQVKPSTGHSVAAVDISVGGGAWKPLKLQPWGTHYWAASYHLPEGSLVALRATSPQGATDVSDCYRWIPAPKQEASLGACPGDPFDATYSNVKGNDWWVEVTVRANQPLAGVDARVACEGAWHPLTLRNWGAWAASIRVPSGSTVDFRARSISGATDHSGAYTWPTAQPIEPCTAWPEQGSFAQYRFRGEERWSDVDGAHRVLTDGLVEVRRDGDVWAGTCDVVRSHYSQEGWSNVTERWEFSGGPLTGPVSTSVGATAELELVENCARVIYPDVPVTERQSRTFSVRDTSGQYVIIDAWHGHQSDGNYQADFWWDARHGLMLDWEIQQGNLESGSGYRAEGWLLNTDASFT